MGGYIAESSFGWRAAFTWFGLAGVLYAGVLLVFLKNAPRPAVESGVERTGIGASLGSLFGCGSFILLVLYFTLPAMPGWVVKSWMPSLLAKTFEPRRGQGRHFGDALGHARLARRRACGRCARGSLDAAHAARAHLRERDRHGAVHPGALRNWLSRRRSDVAIAFLVLFGIGWGFFDTNNMPILCQIVPARLRATGYGLMNMASITVGGLAVKKVGAMRDAGAAPSLIFSVCAVAAAVAVVLVLFIRPRIAQARD